MVETSPLASTRRQPYDKTRQTGGPHTRMTNVQGICRCSGLAACAVAELSGVLPAPACDRGDGQEVPRPVSRPGALCGEVQPATLGPLGALQGRHPAFRYRVAAGDRPGA